MSPPALSPSALDSDTLLRTDVLSHEQLAELNAEYDARLAAARDAGEILKIHLRSDASGTSHEEAAEATDSRGATYAARFGRFWSPAFRELVDNERVFPIIQELLSDPAWGHCPPQVPEALRSRIRLDHDNIHHEPPAAAGQMPLRISQADGNITGANALHGGPGNWHITCAYELRDVPPGGARRLSGLAHAGGLGAPQQHGRRRRERVAHAVVRFQVVAEAPGVGPGGAGAQSRGPGGRLHPLHVRPVPAPSPLWSWTQRLLSRDGGRQGEDDARDNSVGGAEREADALLCAPTPVLSPLPPPLTPWPMADQKYVPFGMHHGDAGCTHLSPQPRTVLTWEPYSLDLSRTAVCLRSQAHHDRGPHLCICL